MYQLNGFRFIMKNKKKYVDWKVACVGMICLTIAEMWALSKGINGYGLAIYAAIIGGVIGVAIPNPLKK